MRAVAVLLVPLALGVVACATTESPSASRAGVRTVDVEIVTSSGAPIAGARVCPLDATGFLTVGEVGWTDSAGCVRLTVDGRVTVFQALASGFALERTPPETGDRVRLELAEERVVEGVIVSSQGAPIAGAHVEAFHAGLEFDFSSATAFTDSAGRFRVTWHSGPLELSVDPPDSSVACLTRAPVGLARSVRLELPPPCELVVDLTTHEYHQYVASFLQTRDAAGAWRALSAEIQARHGYDDGRLTFTGLSMGVYRLAAIQPGKTAGLSPSVAVTPGKLAFARCSLTSGRTVMGRIVARQPWMDQLSLMHFGDDAAAPVDSDGRFTLEHVPEGECWLRVGGLFDRIPVPPGVTDLGDISVEAPR